VKGPSVTLFYLVSKTTGGSRALYCAAKGQGSIGRFVFAIAGTRFKSR